MDKLRAASLKILKIGRYENAPEDEYNVESYNFFSLAIKDNEIPSRDLGSSSLDNLLKDNFNGTFLMIIIYLRYGDCKKTN